MIPAKPLGRMISNIKLSTLTFWTYFVCMCNMFLETLMYLVYLIREIEFADSSAPLGFEPEGSCGTAIMEGVPGTSSPPSYLRWARNLNSLLEDPEGVRLFRRYLAQEGPSHADPLEFWFACNGLKNQHPDPEKTTQLVKVIFR